MPLAEIAVDDAYGIESAELRGAENVIVSGVPPTSEPAVPVNAIPVPAVTDDVATFCTAPDPAPYRRLPLVNDVCQVPPLVTASVPAMLARVVVEVQVGIPFTKASTVPLVVDAMRAREVAVFA